MGLGRHQLANLARSGLFRQVFEQAAANLGVQALGALTTLSFVHLLPTREYALFGLCISAVNFIAIASDLGLMASMTFFWRAEVTGNLSFADHYAAIKRTRLVLFSITSLLAAAVLAWLEHRQNVPPLTIAVSIVLVLLLAWAQIMTAMAILALRLGRQLRRAYSVDLAGALVRAGLAVVAFILLVRNAWFPLASLGAASLVTLVISRKHLPAQFRTHITPSRAAIRNVVRFIIPTMPATMIFSTQELFVYALASLSGGATVVAQTFALGRLAAIFVTLNSVMANVIIPRVVNLTDDRNARRTGLLSVGIIASVCGCLITCAALFPDLFLLLLGRKFSDLRTPLLLSLGAASLQTIAHSLGQFNRSMGWVRWETPLVLLNAAVALALVPFFHFGTAQGVLTFNLVLALLWLIEIGTIYLLGPRGMVRTAGKSSPAL